MCYSNIQINRKILELQKMVDKIILKFLGWIDNEFEKIDNLFNFDMNQDKKNKKNKKK
tara:strand:- start:969 stop:1142 length:174 start_codon:yes stop_codon:yes gene_type:complete